MSQAINKMLLEGIKALLQRFSFPSSSMGMHTCLTISLGMCSHAEHGNKKVSLNWVHDKKKRTALISAAVTGKIKVSDEAREHVL